MGNNTLSPAEASRFAMAEAVCANNGMLARLDIPLDFLVVSDHAELMAIMLKLRESDPRLLENQATKRIREVMASANPYQFGMIGSADSHTSRATAAEDTFWGKASMVEPGTDRTSGDPSGTLGSSHPDTELTKGWTFGASRYATRSPHIDLKSRDTSLIQCFSVQSTAAIYAGTAVQNDHGRHIVTIVFRYAQLGPDIEPVLWREDIEGFKLNIGNIGKVGIDLPSQGVKRGQPGRYDQGAEPS